jgi:hypothetical protein
VTITVYDTLTSTECCSCGVHFAIPKGMLKAKQSDGSSFYCPNGHILSWRKTDADRLREELATAKTDLLRAREARAAEREYREQAERQAAAYKGVATKAKKRAAAALCPCCNRSFVQMRRHLTAKHPDSMASLDVPANLNSPTPENVAEADTR